MLFTVGILVADRPRRKSGNSVAEVCVRLIKCDFGVFLFLLFLSANLSRFSINLARLGQLEEFAEWLKLDSLLR